jgi:beta-mannanase
MRWVRHVAFMGENKKMFWWESLKKRDYSED